MGAYGFERGRKWRSDLELVYKLFPRLIERAARPLQRCPAANNRWWPLGAP